MGGNYQSQTRQPICYEEATGQQFVLNKMEGHPVQRLREEQ